jgi:hypothetical protein
MTEDIYLFDAPFGVVDAAVYKHLFSTPLLRFDRQLLTEQSVMYEMVTTAFAGQEVTCLRTESGSRVGSPWDGHMGSIALRGLAEEVKMTIVCTPPKPDSGTGPFVELDKEMGFTIALPDGSRINMHGPAQRDPYAVLRSHQQWAIDRLLRLLSEDGLFPRTAASGTGPRQRALDRVIDFKRYVERQAYEDIYDKDKKPKERFARTLLQTWLRGRSYREVGVRGGRSDLLVFEKDGRFLYETKIWHGASNHQKGLKQIGEYLMGEDSDHRLLGAYYIVFDHTRTHRARYYLGNDVSTHIVSGREVDVVVVSISHPQPSAGTTLPDGTKLREEHWEAEAEPDDAE